MYSLCGKKVKNLKHLTVKKLTKLFLLVACTFSVGSSMISCKKDYDDDIKKINQRLTNLESLVQKANTDITSLKSIVDAFAAKDHIIDITDIEGGYKITFEKKGSVNILNGTNGTSTNMPIISVAEFEGKLHWCQIVDGVTEWITDNSGKMVLATGKDGEAGKTPKLGINDAGYWTVDGNLVYDSNDNPIKAKGQDGQNGQDGQDGLNGQDGQDGLNGDSFFNSVTKSDKEVVFTLANGTTFTIPFKQSLAFGDGSADLVTFTSGVSKEFDVILPTTLTKAEYSAFIAEVKAKSGSDVAIAVRSSNSKWAVEISKGPVFDINGDITQQPKVKVTPSSLILVDEYAVLTVSLIDSKGETISISRPVLAQSTGNTFIIRNDALISSHATINEAIAACANGDVIKVKGGKYDEILTINKIVTIEGLGSQWTTAGVSQDEEATKLTQKITIAANGVVLKNLVVYASENYILNITGENTVVENIKFKYDPGSDSQPHAIQLANTAKGTTIKNCAFQVYWKAIAGIPENLKILNNEFIRTIPFAGSYHSSLEIKGNTFNRQVLSKDSQVPHFIVTDVDANNGTNYSTWSADLKATIDQIKMQNTWTGSNSAASNGRPVRIQNTSGTVFSIIVLGSDTLQPTT